MNKSYKAYEDSKLLNRLRVYLEDITQDNVELVPRKYGYGDHQAEAIIKILKSEIARINVGFENEIYVIDVWGNKEQLTERSFFKALYGELAGKAAEKENDKLKLDQIMTDEFGKIGTFGDKIKKIEEEYEELMNECLIESNTDDNKERLFSETLDSIQATRSFLVYQCEKLGTETVARYLADWTEKQENRKHKYLKNDKDSICNKCANKNCKNGCELNFFEIEKVKKCRSFKEKEEK